MRSQKTRMLQRLLDKASQRTFQGSTDAAFKAWKNTVERTLIKVYGSDSPEIKQFSRLRFFYSAPIMALGKDYSPQHRRVFERDLEVLLSSLKGNIEELEEYGADEENTVPGEPIERASRVFISHSSGDVAFVEELVEILELVGVPADGIFCTSFEGYGIDLGDNFLDAIRAELSSDTLVLFVLTRNFYASPMCLCEMGATWVQVKEHIPILVPPFDFSDVEGVIPLTQGFRLNDALKLNLFKEKLESLFSIGTPVSQSPWERRRDRIISRINKKIADAHG